MSISRTAFRPRSMRLILDSDPQIARAASWALIPRASRRRRNCAPSSRRRMVVPPTVSAMIHFLQQGVLADITPHPGDKAALSVGRSPPWGRNSHSPCRYASTWSHDGVGGLPFRPRPFMISHMRLHVTPQLGAVAALGVLLWP